MSYLLAVKGKKGDIEVMKFTTRDAMKQAQKALTALGVDSKIAGRD